jgi:hypothetical protein
MTMSQSGSHSTLPSLIERSLDQNPRPLEFYLRDQSRLPGPRANLELLEDFSSLVAANVQERPEQVRTLLEYLISDDRHKVMTNTPAEFVMMCGITAFGACAAVRPAWRGEVYELLARYACSTCWRVREGAKIGLQRLLEAVPREAISFLTILARQGNYFQQRAAVASLVESTIMPHEDAVQAAIALHKIVLERLHDVSAPDRKRDDFRALRQSLGFTISIVAAADPEQGFALMRTCASWRDADINWILRENLKKKRLARYIEYTIELWALLA